MLHNGTFHHIGYVTHRIADTKALYIAAGYRATEVVCDSIQQVRICFVAKDHNPRIELVEPLNEGSSVHKLLQKNGVSPYHLCYEVANIDESFNALVERGFTPLFRPVEAAALDNRRIAYFFKKEIGFIELVNRA
jgi:methylmalonyl-CoA/ethylmalonyl-CoA epimerase